MFFLQMCGSDRSSISTGYSTISKMARFKVVLYARLALAYLVHKLHYARKFSYVPDMHFSFI